MNESEWQACADPEAMLDFVHETGMVSQRKARLFAAAYCRRIWPMYTDERSRQAVEAAEAYADGRIDKHGFKDAWDAEGVTAVGHAIDGATAVDAVWGAGWSALNVAQAMREAIAHERRLLHRLSRMTNADLDALHEEELRAFQAERRAQCAILRDIVGDPFRPGEFNPAWQTPTIVALARSTYESPASDGMLDGGLVLTLGECLADAGCGNAELLEHLQGPGPHWRGCHALDVILGMA